MRRLEQAFYMSLGVTIISLGSIFLTAGQWGWAATALVLGSTWAWSHWRHRHPWGTGAFIGLVVIAAIGVWQSLSATALLLAATAALVSWDLEQFLARWSGIVTVSAETTYVRSHLARLGLAAGGGWALGWLALTVRFTLEFGGVVILGLSAFAGLVWLAMRAWHVFSGTDSNE